MSFLEKVWYKKGGSSRFWQLVLWPCSLLFNLLASVRRRLQQPSSSAHSKQVPLIVVGNISVGGTGKTPLLISLVDYFAKQGLKPGVISRGYGGEAASYPLSVTPDTPVSQSGDEPLLIAERCGCPVVVAPDRRAALDYLLQNEEVDLVLSDDGLQHYKLHRDIEIAVVDGQRLFGNGLCLPAGPLREPVSRLKEVDYIVLNGEADTELPQLSEASLMSLAPKYLINLSTGEKRPFGGAPFNMGNRIQAVSALGNPDRFYGLLERLPYPMEEYRFADHHAFTLEDFEARGIDEHQPVVMTEKDAVKCRGFAKSNFWYLSVAVVLPEAFLSSLSEKVQALRA